MFGASAAATLLGLANAAFALSRYVGVHATAALLSRTGDGRQDAESMAKIHSLSCSAASARLRSMPTSAAALA